MLVIVFAGFMFSGCTNPVSSSGGIANHPIPNSDVFFVGTAQVSTSGSSGPSEYTANCQLGYRDNSPGDSVFNASEITVDGITMTQQGGAGMFSARGLMLSSGDSVVFVVRNRVIGTVRQVLRVPPSIIDCILQPSIPAAGVMNQSSGYSVAWGTGAVGANYYRLQAVTYDSLKAVANTWATMTTSNTLTFPSWIFQNPAGGVYPYLEITVLPFNSISYPGFAAGSGFSVSSAHFEDYTNL